MEAPRVAIGITAHNESRNIGRLLERLRALELGDAVLLRIVVVASGCTDDTIGVVERAVARDARLRLIVDPERRGKAAAINQFIETSHDADVLVLESADTLPEEGAMAALLAPFADPRVGMVGAHPIPEDDESTFVGFTNQLIWRLHHAVATVSPKQGELVAWRNVVPCLPVTAVMDEAYLEAALTRQGYRLAYAPDAIVRNRGPATFGALVTQRRRNHAGHRVLEATEGYRPSTRDHALLARVALTELLRQPRRATWLFAAVLLEMWCALLGWWDFTIAHRSYALWPVIEGTKRLARSLAEQQSPVAVLVVSYNGGERLLECLASVRRNRYPALRTVVVDNGSTDGSGAAVRAAYPDVEVVQVRRNEGLANGFNAGVRAVLSGAPCEHVIFLNDDVVIASDFVEQAVAAAEAEPRAATVTGPIFYYDDPERLWYAGGEILWWLGKTYHRGRRVIWGPAFEAPRRIGYAAATAALFRVEALRAVGPWDEEYFLVFEEADWCVRASRLGWQHRYVSGPRAWHKVSVTFGGEKAAPYLYFLFRNNVRFMQKRAAPQHWPTFLLFFAAESIAWYSLTSLFHRDMRRRQAAIWLAVVDAVRGRFGRGSSDRLYVSRPSAPERTVSGVPASGPPPETD